MRSKLLAAACFLGVAAAAGPASAIECEGNFQIQKNGNQIATPYCQDGYLAIVARQYGMRVSARTRSATIRRKNSAFAVSSAKTTACATLASHTACSRGSVR